MNWKEFKKQVEAGGVTDKMEICYIDVSAGWISMGGINVTIDKELGFCVG